MIGLNIYIISCWVIESMSSLSICQELVCINSTYNFVSIIGIESKHLHWVYASMLNLSIYVQLMCFKFVYNSVSINVCQVCACWVYVYGFVCVKFMYQVYLLWIKFVYTFTLWIFCLLLWIYLCLKLGLSHTLLLNQVFHNATITHTHKVTSSNISFQIGTLLWVVLLSYWILM